MKIELNPFVTPSFVSEKSKPRNRGEGFKINPSWPLSEVDADTLAQLCDDWRVEVFRKAGKVDPELAD